jgi:hypothetical protein
MKALGMIEPQNRHFWVGTDVHRIDQNKPGTCSYDCGLVLAIQLNVIG